MWNSPESFVRIPQIIPAGNFIGKLGGLLRGTEIVWEIPAIIPREIGEGISSGNLARVSAGISKEKKRESLEKSQEEFLLKFSEVLQEGLYRIPWRNLWRILGNNL